MVAISKPGTSQYVASVMAAITTVVSAIIGSMQPATEKQKQMESSKGFRALVST